MMKISKYSFFFDVDNAEFYIYNTLSNALIEIDEELYSSLLNYKNNNLNIVLDEIDKESREILISKKVFTKNYLDDFLYYKSILNTQRGATSFMHLTVAPTMDCCFSCHYCFEKYKTSNYMSEDVMDGIINYLNSLNSKPELKLTWFGGEPLMALSQMERFYEKLVTKYKEPLNSNLITTGFHLNENAIDVIKRLGIQQVQITLDGLKETHNAIKNLSECTDVFNKVLDNVALLLSLSDVHVVFRVNLTKKNKHEYVRLYQYLQKRFQDFEHKGISPAFVMDRGCHQENVVDDFFTSKEIAPFVLDLYNNYQVHSPFLRYPSRFFNECAIRNKMSMSFDPEGYAYKCWEVIGNKEYAIGRINVDGKLGNINEVVLNRHLYGADPIEDPTCSECRYLPICNGGCPIQRIENLFEGGKNYCCTFWKGNLEKLLKVHLQLRKNGFRNSPD